MTTTIAILIAITILNIIDIYLYAYVSRKHGPQGRLYPLSGFVSFLRPKHNPHWNSPNHMDM